MGVKVNSNPYRPSLLSVVAQRRCAITDTL
jgi:hypothetical protein